MLSREDPTLVQGNNQWADPDCQLNVETNMSSTPEPTGMYPIFWIQVRTAFEILDTVLHRSYPRRLLGDKTMLKECKKPVPSHLSDYITAQGQIPQTKGWSILLAGRMPCPTSNLRAHQRISSGPAYTWHFHSMCPGRTIISTDSSPSLQTLQCHICFLLSLIMALGLQPKLQIMDLIMGCVVDSSCFMPHSSHRGNWGFSWTVKGWDFAADGKR